MPLQHLINDFVVARGEGPAAIALQKGATRQARRLLKVVVFGDERATQVRGANEAQRALAAAAAAHQDYRRILREDAGVGHLWRHGWRGRRAPCWFPCELRRYLACSLSIAGSAGR